MSADAARDPWSRARPLARCLATRASMQKLNCTSLQLPAHQADTEDVPGTLHQGILLLFHDDPWLAFDLLGVARPVEGTPIDRRGEIERQGANPMDVIQGYPDLVLVYRDPDNPKRGLVITIEAQKDFDPGKRWSIPAYQSHLAAEHHLDTWSVVVSLDPRMSSALRAWSTGAPPRLDVLLIDVDTVPRSPWLDQPERRPLAAVLVGILHGYAGDLDAARIAFHTARNLPSRRAHRHAMTVLAALSQEQRQQLIGELPMPEQHSWMDVERRSGTYAFGRQEGRQEGLQEGLQQGLEQGRQQGLEQGLEEGLERGLERGLEQGRRLALRELILGSFEERGLALDEHSAARIHGCEDLPTLQRWARRAMVGTTIEQLFE